MITNISLQDFKCFRHLSIDPKLVTVLIGANGAGKSSVLQALMLLKQSIVPGSGSCLNGPLIKIEEQDFRSRIPLNTEAIVGISFSGQVCSNSLHIKDDIDAIEFTCDGEFLPNGILRHYDGEVSFKHSGQSHSISLSEDQDREKIQVGPNIGEIFRSSWPRIFDVVGMGGRTEPQMRVLIDAGANGPGRTLKSMRVIQPIRGLVRNSYQLGEHISEDISLVDGLSRQEEELATTLAYSRDLEDRVSTRMKRITGVGFKTGLAPSKQVKPESMAPGGNVNLAAEGFGTNALISLLLQVSRASEGASVLIEEPEIHLHPKAQAELAEVLSEEAKTHGKQMIMATHSEHILSRLLTLVAEKKLSKDDLAVYSFEKDDDGTCTASEIEVTDSGQVIGGLKGFFDTNLDEMDRYVKALQSNQ